MLARVDAINSVINNFIWGVPAMICIVGVGLRKRMHQMVH